MKKLGELPLNLMQYFTAIQNSMRPSQILQDHRPSAALSDRKRNCLQLVFQMIIASRIPASATHEKSWPQSGANLWITQVTLREREIKRERLHPMKIDVRKLHFPLSKRALCTRTEMYCYRVNCWFTVLNQVVICATWLQLRHNWTLVDTLSVSW